MHTNARLKKPDCYPNRFFVPDDKVEWDIDFPEYRPKYFVDRSVLECPQADPENIVLVKRKLASFEGKINLDSLGRPQNPMGRTGIEGRGLLWLWGPNFAVDAIITRTNPTSRLIEAVLIQRDDSRDSDELAIPGGMIQNGEYPKDACRRELREETGLILDLSERDEIYCGYDDELRNTDHAWIESIVSHRHLLFEVTRDNLKLCAGDDAKSVSWQVLTHEVLESLYGNHKQFLALALTNMRRHPPEPFSPETLEQIKAFD